jgi:thiol:disulfide interchange protein DsbD
MHRLAPTLSQAHRTCSQALLLTLLLWLSASSVQAIQPDELLQPEQAFVLDFQAAAPEQLVAQWTIAEGYYLYRERIRFETDQPGIRLQSVQFPDGVPIVDEFFGPMEVYYDQAHIILNLHRESDRPTQLELTVHSQGCAEVGICYPPERRQFTVDLPPLQQTAADPDASDPPDLIQDVLRTVQLPLDTPTGVPADLNEPTVSRAASTATPPPVSEQDGIAQMLSEQRFWAMPAFFGFGLLLAFTPCVFPMIPILSSLIAGQGHSLTRRRALALSLVYVLAMALTYTAAGMMAALAGQNLLMHLQNPWVLGIFSGLFVLLALAMFGVFRLQIPAAWQTRLNQLSGRRGGSWVGVAIMGVLSALIVGPCVAPPLIGVLTVISLSGDMVLGGSALFAMSLGMGAPLLVIGTSAGHWLPRAGAWMRVVNAIFGVLLLAVAIWLLEWLLPASISMLLWASLLIVCAVYMGALQASSGGWQTLFRGLGVVMLVYGVLLLVGVAAGGQSIWQPLRGTLIAGSPTQLTQPDFKVIKTVADLEQQLAAAGPRPIMLDFYADWCFYCKEMERYTFTDPTVQAQLQPAVLLKADVTAYDAEDRALLNYFNLIGPPAILFFDHTGQERPAFRVAGFMAAEAFSAHLRHALN